ncbi:MAG: hypothetical protein JRF30_06360 [Deltaproteobacteria bacterium]|nr:hypothetical protein [Deltaproteobacteria bacterium]MBW1795314.1 hypothetical protein [Deltaproteobacteria bacterium]MBW2330543.1 hypothetical protein [Deltaproteobacteria bacterium]
MQDDIISALTQEVKEEVIQNYFHERGLIEEQINYLNELAEHTSQLEEKLYRRFARIYEFLIEPEFINQFVHLLGIKEAFFEGRFQKDRDFRNGLRFIKVHGLTHRSRFKKLLFESYRRLCTWNNQYKEAYENLQEECKAAAYNLKKFESDHDLLTILNFLKDMDVEFIEKKHFLGNGFTPQEMASVEATLRFKPIRIERFKLIAPPDLPEPKTIQGPLTALADRVYGQCAGRLRAVMR